MSCSRFMRQIPLAMGQDLGPEQMRSFDGHLRRCLACYREFRDYADALARLDPLRSPPDFDAPDGLCEAIMDEVREHEPGPLAPHPTPLWSRSSRTLRYGLPLAAALAVFLLAGMYAARLGGSAPVHLPQIPRQLLDPKVVTVNRFQDEPNQQPSQQPNQQRDQQPDQLGPSYLFPEQHQPGRLRLIGPASSRRSEPLPAVVVPISKRNDF